jgi:hypothetical protein
MPQRQDFRLAGARRNRFLAWGLSAIAVLLYAAMRWRWTEGF